MNDRKMLRKNEVLVSSLLNGKNYFVNYNIIKDLIQKSIDNKKKIYINFEDVLFSKIVLNQIKEHILENNDYLKYVTFLNNMPLLIYVNSMKKEV